MICIKLVISYKYATGATWYVALIWFGVAICSWILVLSQEAYAAQADEKLPYISRSGAALGGCQCNVRESGQ
jgi:hypothetical protein